jgi:putative DNA primase/helicase
MTERPPVNPEIDAIADQAKYRFLTATESVSGSSKGGDSILSEEPDLGVAVAAHPADPAAAADGDGPWAAEAPDGGGVQRLEDAHIGERIAEDHLRGKFLHASGFGWMKFDGRRWAPATDAVVSEVIRQALIEFNRSEAESRAEPARLQQISRMLSASRIRSLTFIARLLLQAEGQFDAHPDLLNVANGVVDLRTGELRPHDPDLMLTKLAPNEFIPTARHLDWEQALGAVPDDAVGWLQVRLGQGITGHTVPDDRLVVLKGSGANGKTTILDGIREALGPDYAVSMPDRVLLARQGDHPTELMTLRGARLALMEEFPELGHLNVKRLKDALGTGEMTGRLCGRDTVAWKPSHTPIVTTNYLPRVDESDDGTWRRLVLLEFPYRYCRPGTPLRSSWDREGDPRLRERLRNARDGQREAVLAWLISGAVRWYQSDRHLPHDPQSVQDATARWRKNSDVLLRYIDERLAFDPQAQVMATELFEDFNEWLQANGHRPWSDQSFSARFAQHGEAIANGVQKKRARQSPQMCLSRRLNRVSWATGVPTGIVSPAQFTAWVGVRFQTSE